MENKTRTLDGWLLYITNHFTHPVIAAQTASPRYHLARKLAEKGQRIMVYCPLGRHEGNPFRDFVVNLRPKKTARDNVTYLFPPLLVSPASVTTVLSLVLGTLFIVVYLSLTRIKVPVQYSTTILVGTVGAVVKKWKGIPLVANYGDPDFVRETGLALRAFRFCENLVMARRSAYAVVYVDEVVGNYIRTNFPINRTLFLPNGGYESGFSPPARESSEVQKVIDELDLDGKRVAIYVGQISHTYRFDVLISAAQKIVAILPEVTFVLAGDGPALLTVKKVVMEKGLGDLFRFIGPIPYDSVGRYLASADVGLQLLNDMCMGTKVIMYMAHRLPVVSIGSWYDRYHDFLKNGENSILLPPEPDKLATSLVRLLSDTDQRRAIGLAGWETVRPYSWDRHAEETLRLLHNAAGGEN